MTLITVQYLLNMREQLRRAGLRGARVPRVLHLMNCGEGRVFSVRFVLLLAKEMLEICVPSTVPRRRVGKCTRNPGGNGKLAAAEKNMQRGHEALLLESVCVVFND